MPKGNDGVDNPPELTHHNEVRQDDNKGEVPYNLAVADIHTPPAATKEGASPSSSHAKSSSLCSRRSPSQAPSFTQ
jgi:hypothetical protein